MIGTGVEDVTVVRAGVRVLDEVTLGAADGELLVVLGPSGSGKSSLLRTVAGLDEVRSGRVFVRGRDVTGLPPGRRRAAMVFQASALIPFLDVSRNLGWGLRAQHLPEAEVRNRVGDRARSLRLGGCCRGGRASCPRGSGGWPGSGARWSRCPTSSCSTSRSPASTPPSGHGCGGRSSPSSAPACGCSTT